MEVTVYIPELKRYLKCKALKIWKPSFSKYILTNYQSSRKNFNQIHLEM